MINIQISDVLDTLLSKNSDEQKMIFADSFALTSKARVNAEELYTYDCPVCYGVVFFEYFGNKIDDDYIDYNSIDYIKISEYLKEIYTSRIEDKFEKADYEEIKDIILTIENIQYMIKNESIYKIIEYDNGKTFVNMWNKLYEKLEMAPLAGFKQVELEWLSFVHNILKQFLYDNWFDDLIKNTNTYVFQYSFIDPVYKGLQAIGVEIDYDELEDNWKCYHKILRHIVPKDKQRKFSQVCREELKPAYRIYKI